MLIQRKGIDHDPVRPWVWATLPLRGDPVEVVSYPVPAESSGDVIDEHAVIMIRMTVGDPTTIKEVPFKRVACFEPDRHEWWYRPRLYSNEDPTSFIFLD